MFKKLINTIFNRQQNIPTAIDKPERPKQINYNSFKYSDDLKQQIEDNLDSVFKNAVHPSVAMDANNPYASFAMDNQRHWSLCEAKHSRKL